MQVYILLVCMLIAVGVFARLIRNAQKSEDSHEEDMSTKENSDIWNIKGTEEKIEIPQEDVIFPSQANESISNPTNESTLSNSPVNNGYVGDAIDIIELSNELVKHIYELKNYEEMDFSPPTNEDKIIYLPIEGTYNRHFFTKLFLLRQHTVKNVIISDFDMIQYQIPVNANNEELIILIYGKHIISERILPHGMHLGNTLCENVDSEVCSCSATLELYKKLRHLYNDQASAALNKLKEWLTTNTKRAELHYLHSQYRVIKWASEYKLYSIIQFWYNDAIFQYAPEWLSGQSIDIFIPTRGVGIEYQGKQHYSPVDFFGGNDKFEENILRDERKESLCKDNGIELRQWSYENKVRFSDVTFFLNMNYGQVTKRLREMSEFPVENLLLIEGRKERNQREQIRVRKSKVRIPTSVIRQYGKDGVFIGEYNSLQEAHNKTSINITSIQRSISGEQKTAGSYVWRREQYKSIPMEPSIIIQAINATTKSDVLENTGKPKAVIKIDIITGEPLRSYSSIGEAAKDVGINRRGISDVLRGNQKTAGGYIWQYDIEDA